jgi:hypothetical protein
LLRTWAAGLDGGDRRDLTLLQRAMIGDKARDYYDRQAKESIVTGSKREPLPNAPPTLSDLGLTKKESPAGSTFS